MRNRNDLTELEKNILRLVADGYGYDDVAQMLDVSGAVVQNRMVFIMFKLNANNRTHAVVNALRQKAITLEKEAE